VERGELKLSDKKNSAECVQARERKRGSSRTKNSSSLESGGREKTLRHRDSRRGGEENFERRNSILKEQ